MTLCTIPSVPMRPQPRERRLGRPSSGKRLSVAREMPAKIRSSYRRSLDPCDNSNDSGLGFDHHLDPHHAHALTMGERLAWHGERAEAKRPRLDIKLEHDEVNDGYSFPDSVYTCKESQGLIRTAPVSSVPSLSIASNPSSASNRAVPRCIPLANRQTTSSSVPLTSQLTNTSQYADVILQIVKQPEQQHRARYQTEGSRGAVKDREGNGFPVVQLTGYYKPTALQVFIGTDVGKVAPHMFYQACKVSGKNSTPCMEKKIDGTCVIELQLDPAKEMSATCDCVGILKERNVDVEHRFPDQLGSRSKKKSTRCRMIFRTTITLDDGTQETLQVCSQPIVCTQPPGIPEICKKSLAACPATGGLELFIIGKNFLKDTRVVFQQYDDDRHCKWEQHVMPDKEFLQQTHLICVIPQYCRTDITEPVSVRLCVVSSGKTSEPHQFIYTPVGAVASGHPEPTQSLTQGQFFNKMLWSSSVSKREQDLGMMPPPDTNMVPLSTRRSSISVPASSDLVHSPPIHTLKQEYIDENSESSIIDPVELSQGRFRHISESSLDVHHGDSNMSMINDNSIDMIRRNSLSNEMTNHAINENSSLGSPNEKNMEIIARRNSINRQLASVCENANMSLASEDSSCSTSLRCSNSVPSDRLLLTQKMLTSSQLTTNAAEELKVMDLRMKMPMATVADLANTSAPSMATLQKFGVTEASSDPLPAQSAQSVETFLTNIEGKSPPSTRTLQANSIDIKPTLSQIISSDSNGSFVSQKIISRQVIQAQTCTNLLTTTTQGLTSNVGMVSAMSNAEPVFISNQRPYLSTATETETMSMIAKSEAATLADKVLPQATSTMAPSNLNALTTAIENRVSTPINSEKLDALVNSTVESHIGSPERSECKNGNKLASPGQPEIMISSQDVILNQQTNLLMPPMINTRLASPTMQQESSQQVSPTLSPEVILNSQISPSMMCRNASNLNQESLLPPTSLSTITQQSNTVEQSLLPIPVNVNQEQQVQAMMSNNTCQTSPSMSAMHSPIMAGSLGLTNEPEKAVIFEAAVDLLTTQKHIGHLVEKNVPMENKDPMMNKMLNNFITMTTNSSEVIPNSSSLGQISVKNGNNFVQPSFNITPSTAQSDTSKSDFVIPVPVKEMAQNDKKNEDRMIPQAFTSLTENELINLINPSCFDQGNNYH